MSLAFLQCKVLLNERVATRAYSLPGLLHGSPGFPHRVCRVPQGLAPNILRGMSMNVGMMACYDQAKSTMVPVRCASVSSIHIYIDP